MANTKAYRIAAGALWFKAAFAILGMTLAGVLGVYFLFYNPVVLAKDCESDPECGGPESSTIYGYKWYDYNGDGIKDDNEPPLEDWTIYLTGADTFYSTETDSEGYYTFEEAASGDYKVCEKIYDGWSETYPKADIEGVAACDGEGQAPWGYGVSVPGGEYGSFDFRNTYALGEIRAFKFSDLDQNHSYEAGEHLLSGWELCIKNDDIDGPFFDDLWEFFFDDFDECKITDETGYVSWSGLPAGLYETWENMTGAQDEAGWFETVLPEDDDEGEGWVYVAGGEKKTVSFGNATENSIKVTKFWDRNENGERDYYDESEDSSEKVLSGWEFCLYSVTSWNDGGPVKELVDRPDACKTTNDDGEATWNNLEGEDDYIVRESIKDGWFNTNSHYYSEEGQDLEDGEYYVYSLEENETIWAGNDTTSIHAFKWYDANENGEQDALYYSEESPVYEPAIPDWEFCLYGVYYGEDGPDIEELIGCKNTDEDGWVWWYDGEYDLNYGENGYNYYRLKETINEGWSNTGFDSRGDEIEYVYNQEEKNGIVKFWFGHGNYVEFWFGNWRVPEITGHKWEDADADGEWNRETENGIENWNVALGRVGESREGPEGGPEIIPIEIVALFLTSADGGFSLPVSDPGRYKVFEESRQGWRPTRPEPEHIDSFFDITYRIDFAGEPLPVSNWNVDSFFDVFVEPGEWRKSGYDFGNQNLDRCPNLEGVQEEVPEGVTLDNEGNCVLLEPEPQPQPAAAEDEEEEKDDNDGRNTGGGGIVYITPPGEPFGAPQIPGSDGESADGEGQVFGAALTLEEQIEVIKAGIEDLKKEAAALMEELIKILEEKLKELTAQLP